MSVPSYSGQQQDGKEQESASRCVTSQQIHEAEQTVAAERGDCPAINGMEVFAAQLVGQQQHRGVELGDAQCHIGLLAREK